MSNPILTYDGRPIECGYYVPPDLAFFNNDFQFGTGQCVWHDPEGRCFHAHLSSATTKLQQFDGTTWTEIPFTGISSFEGYNIWDDGNSVYLSNGTSGQYMVSYENGGLALASIEWEGYNNMYGTMIWKDGNHIYYSEGENQYEFDRVQYRWVPKTWNGLATFYGDWIWTDGENIYYSYSGVHYVLDRNTSTWNRKTWNWSETVWSMELRGDYVWHLGINTYYSNGFNTFLLDKYNSTWIYLQNPSTHYFYGFSVWHYGKNTYVNGHYYVDDEYYGGNDPRNPHYESPKYHIIDLAHNKGNNFISYEGEL